MSVKKKLWWFDMIASIVVFLVLLTLFAQSYFEAVEGLKKHEADRAAVSEVERFIEKERPQLDPATRRGYAELLIESSHEFRLPVDVLVRVAKQESRFLHTATGDSGRSHGLFQVQGFWVKSIPFIKTERDLYRSDLNIRAGAWVLRYMAERCGDDLFHMLACYNAGEANQAAGRLYAARVMGGA